MTCPAASVGSLFDPGPQERPRSPLSVICRVQSPPPYAGRSALPHLCMPQGGWYRPVMQTLHCLIALHWSRPHMLHKKTECVCVLSHFRLCLTLCDPMDWSPAGFSVHGISQARVLQSVATPSSKIESMSLASPTLTGRFFTTSIIWDAQKAE